MKISLVINIVFLSIFIASLSTCFSNDRGILPVNKDMKAGEKNNADSSIMQGVPGEALQAFLVVHEAFRIDSEIPEQKRVIQNYYVSIKKETNFYSIYFSAKSKSSEAESLGGETDMGKSVQYIVDSRSFKIISKKFMK